MWIGGIRLVVKTQDSVDAGTDNRVLASIVRNGSEVQLLALDYVSENDLERGAVRAYDYVGPTKLPRSNDRTPALPPGIGQSPMPYPGYGIEFSDGVSGHLSLRLWIQGDDMWIKDNVDLYVKQIRRVASGIDSLDWVRDPAWSYIASWSQDVALSTDPDEGVTVWNLKLN
jgi:hypothetical protein